MSARNLEVALAKALWDSQRVQDRAGRNLHDEVIPQLTAAVLQLQIVRMDHPQTGKDLEPVMHAMDEAMAAIRRLSGALAPSLVYRLGIEGALRQIVEDRQSAFAGAIVLDVDKDVVKERQIQVALCEIAELLLDHALRRKGVKNIFVWIRNMRVQVNADGKGRAEDLRGVSHTLARLKGFTFHHTVRKGTMVCIARRSVLKAVV